MATTEQKRNAIIALGAAAQIQAARENAVPTGEITSIGSDYWHIHVDVPKDAEIGKWEQHGETYLCIRFTKKVSGIDVRFFVDSNNLELLYDLRGTKHKFLVSFGSESMTDGTDRECLWMMPMIESEQRIKASDKRIVFKKRKPREHPAYQILPLEYERAYMVVMAADAKLACVNGEYTLKSDDPQLDRLLAQGWRVISWTDTDSSVELRKDKLKGGSKTMIHHKPKSK